jgi:hypothetical protein
MESNEHSLAVGLPRFIPELADDLLMALVHAIKCANGNNCVWYGR